MPAGSVVRQELEVAHVGRTGQGGHDGSEEHYESNRGRPLLHLDVVGSLGRRRGAWTLGQDLSYLIGGANVGPTS